MHRLPLLASALLSITATASDRPAPPQGSPDSMLDRMCNSPSNLTGEQEQVQLAAWRRRDRFAGPGVARQRQQRNEHATRAGDRVAPARDDAAGSRAHITAREAADRGACRRSGGGEDPVRAERRAGQPWRISGTGIEGRKHEGRGR